MISREMKSAFLVTIPLTITLVAAAVVVAGGRAEQTDPRVYQQADLIAKVLTRIENDFVERFDDDKSWEVVYGGLKSMTRKLDPYSVFLNPDESRSFAEETHKNYVGVGFAANRDAPPITIDYLFPGSPAEKAELVPGDRVLSVDGTSIEAMEADRAIELIKGREGSKVKLAVRRAASGRTEEIELERARIDQVSVLDAHLIDEQQKVAYVYVDGFGDSTVTEFDRAMEPLVAQGATALVLDLRFNNGGLLDVATLFANRFLREGAIVGIRYREPKESVTKRADPAECRHPDLPVVVLVNGETASAAEIVAGALQDQKRALLVGQRSYGKGRVQSIWKIPVEVAGGEESERTVMLKLTTAEYLTPSGRLIEKHVGHNDKQNALGGLEPDVTVSIDDARAKELKRRFDLVHVPQRWREQHLAAHRFTLPPLKDRELDAALAVLRGETPAQDF